jgi:hypothetical protein
VLAIRFEDLYADLLRCEAGELGGTLGQILEYVGVRVTAADLVSLYASSYGKGPTAAPGRDKIGRYRTMFKPCHWETLGTPRWQELLRAFGYVDETRPGRTVEEGRTVSV